MIASLSGTVLSSAIDTLVIEVGGVGLSVLASPATCQSAQTGAHVSLSTALVVREDSLTLFGFLDSDDRDAFQILQSVSGIGPRTALAALSTYSADQLRGIVAREDESALMKISGIGKKGAQRLILELADRLGPPTHPTQSVDGAHTASARADVWQSQVREALVGLGWSIREAEEAVAVVEAANADNENVQVSQMLALALRGLGHRA